MRCGDWWRTRSNPPAGSCVADRVRGTGWCRKLFTFDTNWWGNRFTEAPIVVLTAMLVAAWLDLPTRAPWWQRGLFVAIVLWAVVTARVGSFEWF